MSCAVQLDTIESFPPESLVNIAIWGAGRFGEYIYSQVSTNDKIKVICIIDSNIREDKKKYFKEIDIVSPLVYMEKYNAETDVVLVAFFGSIAILEELKNLKIKRYGFICRRVFTYKIPFPSQVFSILRDTSAGLST